MNEFQRAIEHFRSVDPRLHQALISLSNLEKASIEQRLSRRLPTPRLFEDICRTIIGQQLSGKAADTIFKRFKKLCRTVTPKVVASISLEDFRGVGISNAKGRALHDLAHNVTEGTVKLNAFSNMSDEAISEMLIQVRGIGPWTAEMTLMFSLGRPNIFAVGDLGLQKGVQIVYAMRNKPSKEQMEKMARKWSPYRTYAALILWRVLDSKKQKTP